MSSLLFFFSSSITLRLVPFSGAGFALNPIYIFYTYGMFLGFGFVKLNY